MVMVDTGGEMKTREEILADAIVNMYHLSRHSRDEVLKVVQNHWPTEELQMQADRIVELEEYEWKYKGLCK